MSTRLNAYLREKIIENALAKSGLPTELEAINNAIKQWGEEVRLKTNGITDTEIDNILAQTRRTYRQLPEQLQYNPPLELIRKAYFMYVSLAGQRIMVHFAANRYTVSGATAHLRAGDPLIDRYHSLNDKRKEVESKIQTLRATVNGVVNKVSTTKRLLDMWPEAKELLPENLEEAKVNVPALVVADLNAMIGLTSQPEQTREAT